MTTMLVARWSRSVFLSGALALAACDGDVCGGDELPICDTRDEACQDVAIDVVECLRGGELAERPTVSVITPAELEARLREGADPMMMQTLQWEDALHQLGVLAPDVSLLDAQVESRVATVAAFFSPMDNAVFVIDRGEPSDSAEKMTVLVHELVHAAQHQDHDLSALARSTTTHDEHLRTRLAVEGEATFYQLEALAWSEGVTPSEVDWRGYYADWVQRLGEAHATEPSPYFLVYGAWPYALGGRYATWRWLEGDDAAVRQIVPDLPASSELARDPWSTSTPPPRQETSVCDAPPAPEGYELALHDEMGPLFVYAFLRSGARTPHGEAWGIASRWRRDDLYVYGEPGGEVTLAWRVEMSDTAGARWLASHAQDLGYAAQDADGFVTLTSGASSDGWTWDASPPPCAFR